MEKKTVIALSLMLVFVILIVLAGAINTVFHYTSTGYYVGVVEGESMNPNLQNGDVLLYGPYEQIEEGDLIRFQPEESEKIIVHRVVNIDHSREDPYKMKGDNNANPDGWFTEDEIKSEVENRLINMESIIPLVRGLPYPS